jgi:hypothetical protein
VVDCAQQRVASLSEFASDCTPAARQLCERERAKAFREFAGWMKQAVTRAVQSLRPRGKPAHA